MKIPVYARRKDPSIGPCKVLGLFSYETWLVSLNKVLSELKWCENIIERHFFHLISTIFSCKLFSVRRGLNFFLVRRCWSVLKRRTLQNFFFTYQIFLRKNSEFTPTRPQYIFLSTLPREIIIFNCQRSIEIPFKLQSYLNRSSR